MQCARINTTAVGWLLLRWWIYGWVVGLCIVSTYFVFVNDNVNRVKSTKRVHFQPKYFRQCFYCHICNVWYVGVYKGIFMSHKNTCLCLFWNTQRSIALIIPTNKQTKNLLQSANSLFCMLFVMCGIWNVSRALRFAWIVLHIIYFNAFQNSPFAKKCIHSYLEYNPAFRAVANMISWK